MKIRIRNCPTASVQQYGGQQNFLPAPMEYAYLANGGIVDKYGHGGYNQYGGATDQDGDIDMMKSGGIHIKPENRGKFNATKAKTGKSTEELTHSSNLVTRKRAIFAQNAAKWHHEYGGSVDPHHPLTKYMAYGGDTEEDVPNLPPANGSAWGTASPDQAFGAPPPPQAPQVPTIPTDPNQNTRPPVSPNRANPQEAPTDASGFNNPQADQNYGQPSGQSPMYHRQPYGTGFNNLLGAGLMTTSYFEDRRNARNQAGYNRQLGMSQNAFPTQQGSRGDYTQQGQFKPDQMTSGSAGMYYPNRQYGSYQAGGYTQGSMHDMDEHEIAKLLKSGYKIEYL